MANIFKGAIERDGRAKKSSYRCESIKKFTRLASAPIFVFSMVSASTLSYSHYYGIYKFNDQSITGILQSAVSAIALDLLLTSACCRSNKKAELSQSWPRNAPYIWVPWKFSGAPDQDYPNFFEYPLLSQERVSLRTSNCVCTFIGSIWTKVH